MPQYRIEYMTHRYRGVYGSGDDGWERFFQSRIFEAVDDKAAVEEIRKIERLNHNSASYWRRVQKLIRIDRPEEVTEISLVS